MTEYIDREKLLKQAVEFGDSRKVVNVFDIENAPAENVAPVVRGKWIQLAFQARHPYAQNYFCSNCEKLGFATNYCPHCGAKMEPERFNLLKEDLKWEILLLD